MNSIAFRISGQLYVKCQIENNDYVKIGILLSVK